MAVAQYQRSFRAGYLVLVLLKRRTYSHICYGCALGNRAVHRNDVSRNLSATLVAGSFERPHVDLVRPLVTALRDRHVQESLRCSFRHIASLEKQI